MIFVSLGTHPHPFTRLVNELARLMDEKKLKEKVIVQTGYTPFTHSKMECIDFISIAEFEKTLGKCRLFITHAGEGNIGTAIQMGKQMIIVPRQKKFDEHTNDHQLELGNAAIQGNFGMVVMDIAELESALRRVTQQKVVLKGYIPQTLGRLASEYGVYPLESFPTEMVTNSPRKSRVPKSASIVVATLNGGEPLIRAVKGMLVQSFKGKYEIIVVDDGSFDGKTPELLKKHFAHAERIKLVFLPRSGVCKARNAGIRKAKYEVVINMDHDCIPQKNWLQTMVNGFDSPNVGAVSAYGHYGGTSTGFRKELLDHFGGYDEDYFYYREDTDLSFKIMELGFEYKKISGASRMYTEDRTLVTPKGIKGILKYTLQRFKYHMNDVLLHKKHPTPLCNRFLHVKGKLFVDPREDFKVCTGLWENPSNEIQLSSPRGISFLKNSSPAHFIFIVLAGLGYAFAIKWARLAGSIKHRHFLV